MKTSVEKMVIAMLKDYPRLDQKIKDRREELKRFDWSTDENVGGGKSQNKPWTYYDTLIDRWQQDDQINAWQREKAVISDCYNHADDDTRLIIRSVYFGRGETIRSLIATDQLYCSLKTAYAKRNHFIEDVARRLHILFL